MAQLQRLSKNVNSSPISNKFVSKKTLRTNANKAISGMSHDFDMAILNKEFSKDDNNISPRFNLLNLNIISEDGEESPMSPGIIPYQS